MAESIFQQRAAQLQHSPFQARAAEGGFSSPFQARAAESAAAEFDIDDPQKLAPISTFWNALTQSTADKPAAALRGATAFTPGESLGLDRKLERAANYLSTIKDPQKRAEVEQSLQGLLWPSRSDTPWYDVDANLVPNAVNSWAAQVGDQIPIMVMSMLGKMAGKKIGKAAGVVAGGGAALATGGPDPTDAVTAPLIAAVTAKVVEHVGGAAPMVLIETGSFLKSAEQHGLDKDIAEKYARMYGPAAGAIEYTQQLWNIKALKGASDPVKKKLIGRVLMAVGGNALEGLEEVSQGGLERFLIGKAMEEMKERHPDYVVDKPKVFSKEESGREFAIGFGIGTMSSATGKAVQRFKTAVGNKKSSPDSVETAATEAMAAIDQDENLTPEQKAAMFEQLEQTMGQVEELTAEEKVYMKGFAAKLTSIRNNADNMLAGAGNKKSQRQMMKADLQEIVDHYESIADEIEQNKVGMPELDEIKQLLPDYKAAVEAFVKSPSEEGFSQIKEMGDRIGELGAEYGENISTERAKEIGGVGQGQQQQQQQPTEVEQQNAKYEELLARTLEGDQKAAAELRDLVQAMNRPESTLPTYDELLERANEGDQEAVDALLSGYYQGGPAEQEGIHAARRQASEPAQQQAADKIKLHAAQAKAHSLAKRLGVSEKERQAMQVELTGKKSMKDMTAEEAAKVVQQLEAMAGEKGVDTTTADDIADFIEQARPAKKVKESAEYLLPGQQPGGTKGVLRKFVEWAKTFELNDDRMMRICESLDGFWNGPMSKNVWRRVRNALNGSRRTAFARKDAFREAMVSDIFVDENGKYDKKAHYDFLKQDKQVVTKAKTTEGKEAEVSLRSWERVGVYVYAKQPGSQKRLRATFADFKNPDAIIADVLQAVSPQERAVGDYMIEELDQHFNRIQNAAKIALGRELTKHETYFMMRGIQQEVENIPDLYSTMLDMVDKAVDRPSEIGEVKERTPGANAPLDLDVFTTYIGSIPRMEQFIHVAPLAKQVGEMLGNKRLQQVMNQRIDGSAKFAVKWFKDAARGYASDGGNDSIDQTVRWFRKRGVRYFLMGNIPSIGRQAISWANGMGEHPVLFARGLKYVAAQWAPGQFKKMKDTALTKSKLLDVRNFERDYSRDAKSLERWAKNKKDLDQIAFAGQRWMDSRTTILVWNAAYDSAINSEAVQKHAKLDGSDAMAIDFADNVIEKSQPMGDVEHLPGHFRNKSEFMKSLTTFKNMPNQTWLQFKHDIIGARIHGRISTPMMFYREIVTQFLAAFLLGLTRRGRIWWGEDWWKEMFTDLVGIRLPGIVLFGDFAMATLEGYAGANTSVQMAPLNEASKAYKDITKAGGARSAVWQAGKAIGALSGRIPVQAFRTAEGAKDLATGESTDPRRLLWSEWSLKTKQAEEPSRGGSSRTRSRSSSRSRR